MHNFDINKFRRGDTLELEKLFMEFFRPISLFAKRIVKDESAAEDIAQECFVNLWKAHENFEDLSRIRGYLYMAARQASFFYNREKKRHELIVEDLTHVMDKKEEDADLWEFQIELLKGIRKEINRLPDRYKTIFKLMVIDGLNSFQVAEKLHITPNNARMQKTKAIRMIRSEMSKKNLLRVISICVWVFPFH